jgi:hypothetical protein
VSVLAELEGDVTNTLQSIKKGIALLDDRRASLDGAGPATDDVDEEAAWTDEAAEPSSSTR